jgi:protein SCO1/2
MRYLLFIFIAGLITSCINTTSDETSTEPTHSGLPYLGFHEFVPDTIYHTVPPFSLMAQDSSFVDKEMFDGKVHVVNFFFTSCPAICPAMIEQMKRLQKNTEDIEEIVFLSHTIDPDRDSIPRLNWYINEKNIDTKNWYFLYGEKEYVYDLGENGYMINAMEDEAAEGGFLHSEHFVLVDREGHIRGLYDGTQTTEVDQLEKDIRKLLKTEYGNEH